MDACDPNVPYTLLGLLLRGGGELLAPPSSTCPAASAAASGFFRQYAVRATNALLWISLITVTLLLLRKLARLARLWALGGRIPGPPHPSLFGHYKLVADCRPGGDLTGYLSKLHEKFGPVVRLWLSPTQLLVSVTDVSLIKEVLLKAKDKMPLTGRAFRLAFGRCSLFVSSFEKVQKMRESLAIHLNGKLLKRANSIPPKVVEFVMERVDSTGCKGVLICRSVSQHLAFYTIGATLFGDSFLSWSDATLYEELLMVIAKEASFWAACSVPPYWRKGFWRYQFYCTRLKHLTQGIIQQCRDTQSFLGQNCQDSNEDFLVWEEIEGHSIPKEEQCGNMMSVMFHGYLNTANLITIILTRLVLNPDIQEKIYSEIISVQKRKCKEDLYDVQKMHFLLATVSESARLLPAGPLLQRCSLRHDLSLQTGVTIPAGSIIGVPLQLVHTDNSIWGMDACQFNPRRFLSKGNYSSAALVENDSAPMPSVAGSTEELENFEERPSMFIEPDNNAAFLSFGSGERACIGQKLAVLGISNLIASLLQKYEIRLHQSLENDTKPVMDDCALELLPSPKVIFTKRGDKRKKVTAN